MQPHLISEDLDNLLILDVINEDFREQSFKHLQREEEASIGHTQFSKVKREESIQREIGK